MREEASASLECFGYSRPTRLHVSYDVCELSVAFPRATVGYVLKLNQVIGLHRLTADNMRLYFSQMSPLEDCQLECFSDAAFVNLSDNGSQGAFIIFLRDKKGLRCPLYWKSKKIRRVAKSTLTAETLALVDGAEACVFTKHVATE